MARNGDVSAVLKVLRRLSVLDFGRLHLDMPNGAYPALSKILPSMATDEVQRGWTGSAGYDMFRQTKDFVLRLQFHFERICRRPLSGSTILDYGCGWGRLARMMTYYSDPAEIFGVDPMQQSIDLCRESRVLGNISLCNYLPEDLGIGKVRFDLIYAYSVFTHTSKRATIAALNTLRRYVKPDGLLILTVRPVEIWDLPEFGENPLADQPKLVSEFEQTGFAFLPNLHFETDGDYTYGVTTMSPEWLTTSFPEWEVVGGDRGEDHLQYIVMLKPF